jgi:hypothetical protein
MPVARRIKAGLLVARFRGGSPMRALDGLDLLADLCGPLLFFPMIFLLHQVMANGYIPVAHHISLHKLIAVACHKIKRANHGIKYHGLTILVLNYETGIGANRMGSLPEVDTDLFLVLKRVAGWPVISMNRALRSVRGMPFTVCPIAVAATNTQ